MDMLDDIDRPAEKLEEIYRQLESEHGFFAAQKFKRALVLYEEFREDSSYCEDTAIAKVWPRAKRLVHYMEFDAMFQDDRFSEVERFLKGLAPGQKEPEELLQDIVKEFEGRQDLVRGHAEALQWLVDTFGDAFCPDAYNHGVSNKSFWSGYADYIITICEQLDYIDESDARLVEVMGRSAYLEEQRFRFWENVETAIENANERTGRVFSFNEIAGLYSLLRKYDRKHDTKAWCDVYRYMYGDDAAGVDTSWIDDLPEDEEPEEPFHQQDPSGQTSQNETLDINTSESTVGSRPNAGEADAFRDARGSEMGDAAKSERVFVSDVIDMSSIVKGKLNLVYAPCGSGKTYFIEHKLKDSNQNPLQDMLYLAPTVALSEAFMSRGVPRQYIGRDGGLAECWKQDGATAMTYAAFGARIKRAKDEGAYKEELFWNDHSLICADELSQAIKQSHYDGGGADNYTRVAIEELGRRIQNDTNTVVTISATPRRLTDRFFFDVHLVKTEPRPVGYCERRSIKYFELDSLLRKLDSTKRGMIYIGRIDRMNKAVSILEERGIRALAIYSRRSKSHRMNEEQLAAVDSLVRDEKVPDDVQVLIINAAYETGLNIRPEKSALDYIVVHDSSEEVQIQVRGRYRGDIDTVYYRELPEDAYDREIPAEVVEPYLDRRLTTDDTAQLSAELAFTDNRNREKGWRFVKKVLLRCGYAVTSRTSNGKRFTMIELPTEEQEVEDIL